MTTSAGRRLGVGRGASLFVKGVVGDVREQRRRSAAARHGSTRRGLGRVDPRVRRPVFVIGSPRSGTTFLAGALGQVAALSYHFEPRLTKAAAGLVYDGSWSRRRAAVTFRVFYGTLQAVNGDGGKRFAEKNPENCFIVSFLAETFPDSVFIHIVRDGRDAAVSHSERPWLSESSRGSGRRGRGGTDWGPAARFWVEPQRREEFARVSDLHRTAWAWRRFTAAAHEGLASVDPARWVRVHYEDVVREPAGAARTLAGFLGLDDRGHDELGRGLSGARVASVGRWRTAVPEGEHQRLAAACGPLLGELGYH